MPIPNPKVKPQLFPDQGKATQSQKENWEERKNKTVGILCISLELSYKTGHSTNLWGRSPGGNYMSEVSSLNLLKVVP